MDIALIALIVIGGAAIIGSLVALLAPRPPRVRTDPERLRRLRDRVAAQEERRHVEELRNRIAAENDARDPSRAPQRRDPGDPSPERIWAGAF